MRNVLLAACLALAAVPATAAEMEYFIADATGTLTVAADGTVADVDLDGARVLGSEVLEGYEAHIRKWRFEPVVEDGKPVNVRAHLMLSIVASREKGAEQTLFGIRNVWFLDPPTSRGGKPVGASSGLQPPVYPSQALRAGAGAEVMLLIELGEGGQVARVASERVSMLGSVQGKKTDRMARLMAAAAESTAAGWRIDGYEAGSRVRVPVKFSTVRDGWQRLHPQPVDTERAPWVLAALADRGVTDMAATGGTPARLELLSDLPKIPGLDEGG